jgi:peptide/nickel transport system substrate-binding protein
MMVTPGTNGYDPELDRRLPFDPGRAKALLAEAGYPDGFAVRLDCPRLPLRQEACENVAAQLAAVGLRVAVDVQPFPVYRQRIAGRATDFYLTSDQAGMTLDAAEVFRDLFYSPRPYWQLVPGYADPATDALIERIDGEVSSPIRDALIEQAWRKLLDEVVVVPLYHVVAIWAMRDKLEVPPHALPWPLFRQAQLVVPR